MNYSPHPRKQNYFSASLCGEFVPAASVPRPNNGFTTETQRLTENGHRERH